MFPSISTGVGANGQLAPARGLNPVSMVRIFVGVAGAAHKKPNDFIIMTGAPSALSP